MLEKRFGTGVAASLLLAFPVLGQQPIYQAATAYDETRIRARAYPIGQADLSTPSGSKYNFLPNPAPFGTDGFVGLQATIFSDDRSEAMSTHRMAGFYQGGAGETRSGNWAEYFRYTSGNPSNAMRLGVDNLGQQNFFNSTFRYLLSRRFGSMALPNRGYMKVEYICPSACGSSNVSAYYFKIGSWDMQSKSAQIFSLPSPLTAVDIVSLDAVIHSDGGPYHVDNISHIGSPHGALAGYQPESRGRGGMIWYGLGCTGPKCGSGSNPGPRIHLHAGPRDANSSYPQSVYGGRPYWNTSTDPQVPIPYTNLAANRGWVKIEFTGKTLPQPAYAIRSKAVAIGPWDMAASSQAVIPLSSFGISVQRIVGIQTTIQSDPKTDATNTAGWGLTNFGLHKNETPSSNPPDPWARGGGVTLATPTEIRLLSQKYNNVPGPTNYFSRYHSLLSSNGVAYNRGWVKLDYLSGSCENGPAGFSIKAIPGLNIATCPGTATTVTLQGGGQDIFNSADDFAFTYKVGAGDKDLQFLVEAQYNSSGWAKAGIMFRSSLADNAKHASILITPSNGAHFTWRPDNTSATSRTSTNSVKAPYYLRIKKAGNIFTAYYRPNLSVGWTQVGTSQTITSFGTNSTPFYYGVALSSNSTLLTSVRISGMTGF